VDYGNEIGGKDIIVGIPPEDIRWVVVEVEGEGSITINNISRPVGVFKKGDSVHMTAVPKNDAWVFEGWYYNGVKVTADGVNIPATYPPFSLNENMTYTAKFIPYVPVIPGPQFWRDLQTFLDGVSIPDSQLQGTGASREAVIAGRFEFDLEVTGFSGSRYFDYEYRTFKSSLGAYYDYWKLVGDDGIQMEYVLAPPSLPHYPQGQIWCRSEDARELIYANYADRKIYSIPSGNLTTWTNPATGKVEIVIPPTVSINSVLDTYFTDNNGWVDIYGIEAYLNTLDLYVVRPDNYVWEHNGSNKILMDDSNWYKIEELFLFYGNINDNRPGWYNNYFQSWLGNWEDNWKDISSFNNTAIVWNYWDWYFNLDNTSQDTIDLVADAIKNNPPDWYAKYQEHIANVGPFAGLTGVWANDWVLIVNQTPHVSDQGRIAYSLNKTFLTTNYPSQAINPSTGLNFASGSAWENYMNNFSHSSGPSGNGYTNSSKNGVYNNNWGTGGSYFSSYYWDFYWYSNWYWWSYRWGLEEASQRLAGNIWAQSRSIWAVGLAYFGLGLGAGQQEGILPYKDIIDTIFDGDFHEFLKLDNLAKKMIGALEDAGVFTDISGMPGTLQNLLEFLMGDASVDGIFDRLATLIYTGIDSEYYTPIDISGKVYVDDRGLKLDILNMPADIRAAFMPMLLDYVDDQLAYIRFLDETPDEISLYMDMIEALFGENMQIYIGFAFAEDGRFGEVFVEFIANEQEFQIKKSVGGFRRIKITVYEWEIFKTTANKPTRFFDT